VNEIEYSDGQIVNLEFDEAKHWYKVEGEYVPSVTGVLRTTIAKPALMYWAVNCAVNYVDEFFGEVGNADSTMYISEDDIKNLKSGMKGAHNKVSGSGIQVGKDFHKYAEEAVSWKLGNSTEIPELPTDLQTLNSVNAFREWVNLNEIKWLSSEEKIYNRELKFAGTVDAVAEINDEFCVIDWKTGSGIYEEMYLQCAAYAKTIEDIYGRNVDAFYILRLDKKTGKYESARSSEVDEHFNAFKHSLGLYHALNSIKNKGK
jgi:hypothetical protein